LEFVGYREEWGGPPEKVWRLKVFGDVELTLE
jgi:hypothetical protein